MRTDWRGTYQSPGWLNSRCWLASSAMNLTLLQVVMHRAQVAQVMARRILLQHGKAVLRIQDQAPAIRQDGHRRRVDQPRRPGGVAEAALHPAGVHCRGSIDEAAIPAARQRFAEAGLAGRQLGDPGIQVIRRDWRGRGGSASPPLRRWAASTARLAYPCTLTGSSIGATGAPVCGICELITKVCSSVSPSQYARLKAVISSQKNSSCVPLLSCTRKRLFPPMKSTTPKGLSCSTCPMRVTAPPSAERLGSGKRPALSVRAADLRHVVQPGMSGPVPQARRALVERHLHARRGVALVVQHEEVVLQGMSYW